MKFEVELAEKADRDLRNIFFYIAVDLSAPENAERQINRLWDAILSLDELPERYRRYEDEPWYSRGMRVLPIDNFVILYIPYLEEKVVRIVTVMYGGRDISEHYCLSNNCFIFCVRIVLNFMRFSIFSLKSFVYLW